MPFSGWSDHGFFNFQPTFYWDLATANNYDLITFVYNESSPLNLIVIEQREDIINMYKDGIFSHDSMLFVVYKKNNIDTEFTIPMQGYYAQNISDDSTNAWRTLRFNSNQ